MRSPLLYVGGAAVAAAWAGVDLVTRAVGSVRSAGRYTVVEPERPPAAMIVKCGSCRYGDRCREAGDCLLVDRHPEKAA